MTTATSTADTLLATIGGQPATAAASASTAISNGARISGIEGANIFIPGNSIAGPSMAAPPEASATASPTPHSCHRLPHPHPRR